MAIHKARYQVQPIANAEHTAVHEELLAKTNDIHYARHLATIPEYSALPFGAAVVDTEEDQIDYGDGFRKPDGKALG